jgi:hypothetical protein
LFFGPESEIRDPGWVKIRIQDPGYTTSRIRNTVLFSSQFTPSSKGKTETGEEGHRKGRRGEGWKVKKCKDSVKVGNLFEKRIFQAHF